MKTKKRFGQHLLKDPDDARRIALALPVAQESILEIGPGAGALTAALLDSHPQAVVTAVEFDRDMVALLERRFKDEPRLRVVQGDILTYDPAPHGTELTVAGNLPYNISAPVLDWTVKNCKVIARALFMLQREVADRLASEPGSKDWSPLAIMTQLSYEIKSEFTLGPERFTPPPKVSSTVVALARLAQPPDCLPVLFERTVRVAFANRRKTLLNNLISGFSLSRPGVQEILDRLELAHNIRAEELSTERFISLAGVLESD